MQQYDHENSHLEERVVPVMPHSEICCRGVIALYGYVWILYLHKKYSRTRLLYLHAQGLPASVAQGNARPVL